MLDLSFRTPRGVVDAVEMGMVGHIGLIREQAVT